MQSLAQGYSWHQISLQGMGFVTGIIAHPTEPNLIYVRTDVGGVYRWRASSSSWTPLNDGKFTGYGIESIALTPSNPDLLFASIAENDTGKVWVSPDRGTHWSTTGLTLYMEPNGEWRSCGERLTIDPYDSQRLYYGSVRQGLWKSSDGGAHWLQVDTTQLPVGREGGLPFVLCDASFGSSTTGCTRLYAGVHGFGVYRSVNGGDRWELIGGGPDTSFRPMQGALSQNGTLYVSYRGSTGALYRAGPQTAFVNSTPPNAGSAGLAVLMRWAKKL